MDAINSLSTYKAYFKELATGTTGHKDLKAFYYGDIKRLLEAKRGNITYPCLWLELPSIPIQDHGSQNFQINLSGAFAIITNSTQDDYDKQDDIIENNFQITHDIISRIKRDSFSVPRLFNLDLNSFRMDPIARWNTDNCFGWRTEFKINNAFVLDYISSKWNP